MFGLLNAFKGIGRFSEKDMRNLLESGMHPLLEIKLPESGQPDPEMIVRILEMLYHRRKSVFSYEFWKMEGRITIHIYASDRDLLKVVKSQFQAAYPRAVFKTRTFSVPRLKKRSWVACREIEQEGYLFGLKKMRECGYDRLSHIFELMSEEENDIVIQILFRPLFRRPKIVDEFMMQRYGNVTETPVFDVRIKVFAMSDDPEGLDESAEYLSSLFSSFNGPMTSLKTAGKLCIPFLCSPVRMFKKSMERKMSGKRIYMTADELASMVHLPAGLKTRGVEYARPSLASLPAVSRTDDGITIGRSLFREKKRDRIGISAGELMKHQYIIGATGTGKSTLMINEMLQAAEMNMCVTLIDPHGDLAEDVVESLPENFTEKVVFLDPVRVRFSLNPFQLPRYSGKFEREMMIERIIGETTGMMKRLFGAQYWGPALNRTFQNSLRFLYEKDDSPTFRDIFDILVGKRSDAAEIRELQRQLRLMPFERTDAVMNKIEPFVRNRLLNILFCRKESSVDFDELIKPGNIVVWRISKGELSEVNTGMIGSAIISKIWFHTISKERPERTAHLMFIDEFHNFGHLETLGMMVTEGRKYNIGLVLAHQQMKQIPEKILLDVMGNCATKIIFRVSGEDAWFVSRTLDPANQRELTRVLVNLPVGTAVVKLPDIPNPVEVATPPPPVKRSVDWESVISRMTEKYSRKDMIADERVREMMSCVLEIEKSGKPATRSEILKTMKMRRPEMTGSDLIDIVNEAKKLGLVETGKVRSKGRPKIITRLTGSGLRAIGKIPAGTSRKAGGDLHRVMIMKKAEELKGSFFVVIPEQSGTGEQSDLIAYPYDDVERPVAYEIEVRAQHPEQIRKNYFKNARKNREVVFVTPDETVRSRVKSILQDIDPKVRVEVLKI